MTSTCATAPAVQGGDAAPCLPPRCSGRMPNPDPPHTSAWAPTNMTVTTSGRMTAVVGRVRETPLGPCTKCLKTCPERQWRQVPQGAEAPSLCCVLHCPVRLRLQNTKSKVILRSEHGNCRTLSPKARPLGLQDLWGLRDPVTPLLGEIIGSV